MAVRVWRLGAVAGLMALLSACLPQDAPPSDIRDPKANFAATSRFDEARFAGQWLRRATFAGPWQVVSFEYVAAKGGKPGAWREVALNGEASAYETRVATVTPDLPGVFTLRYSGGETRQMVVVWVDEGFRTAALATRDGSYAVIVDRKKSGGADRIVAAKSVLEANGFAVGRMWEPEG